MENEKTETVCQECGWDVGVFRYHVCNPEQRTKYIASLHEQVEELEKENRRLVAENREFVDACRLGNVSTQRPYLCPVCNDIHTRCENAKNESVGGERMVTMWYCEECGEARSSRHECDVEARSDYISSPSAHRDQLQREVDSLRSRCDALEAERDEARQWANRRTAMVNELYNENTQLQEKLAHAKVYGEWERNHGEFQVTKRLEQIASLRTQLAEARNKALDEAIVAIRDCLESRNVGYHHTSAATVAILALKS